LGVKESRGIATSDDSANPKLSHHAIPILH
jgi:hypothetical protein